MSAPRWYLPLGVCSPVEHAAGPDYYSLCGLWDLARPSALAADGYPASAWLDRQKCAICLAALVAA